MNAAAFGSVADGWQVAFVGRRREALDEAVATVQRISSDLRPGAAFTAAARCTRASTTSWRSSARAPKPSNV